MGQPRYEVGEGFIFGWKFAFLKTSDFYFLD